MTRLTRRDEFGNADIIGVDSADLQLNLDFEQFNLVTAALNKLADYEDSGLTPAEVKQLSEGKAIYEAYDGSKLDKADQYIEHLENRLKECVELLKRFAFVDPDESMTDRLDATSDVQELLRKLEQGDWVDKQIEQNRRDFEDSADS